MISIVLLFFFIAGIRAGPTCVYEEHSNGFLDTICTTDTVEYQAPCADAGVSGYCHGLQVDPCTSSDSNGFTLNSGNEPDGVTRTCEHHQTGHSHVVCCRDAPGCYDHSVQCTALKDPEGSLVKENCITPGPLKIQGSDNLDDLDELNRDWRLRVTYPIPIAGNYRTRAQNDTTSTWSWAYETCSNLDGGDKGWRLCKENEIYTGACCKESSGVQVCEFHDADVWLDEFSFCDSVTTCEVVEEFQYTKNTLAGFKRGDGLEAYWVNNFCTSSQDTGFRSSRQHLCESYFNVFDQKQRCVPLPLKKLMGDNSGRFGYFVFRLTASVSSFPHTILDRYDLDDGLNISYLHVNMTRDQADAFEECQAGIPYPQCVVENIAFNGDAEMGDYEECESEPMDEESPTESRLRTAARSSIENKPSVFSPETYAYVVDSGVRPTHKTFGSRVLSGYDVWEGSGEEVGLSDVSPKLGGHGTHVAGTIAGSGYRKGVPTGVARHTFIVPINIFNKNNYADLMTFYKALRWIYQDMKTKAGARFVINLSICKADQGTKAGLRADVQEMIDNILQNQGVILSAACNKGEPVDRNMFGNYPGIFVVGSTKTSTSDSVLSYFSGWDSNVDTHTQGEDVWSASNQDDNGLVKKAGTSMATPYVSGIFAKLWEIHPEKTSAELISYFVQNCISGDPITYTTKHNWCKIGERECPYHITSSRLDVELENCLAGVVVGCPADNGACSVEDIAELYDVSVSQIEFVGQSSSSNINIATLETDKYRIKGTIDNQQVTPSTLGIASIDATLSPTRPPICTNCTYAPTSTPPPDDEDSNTATLVGGVLGGVVVIGLFIYFAYFKQSGATVRLAQQYDPVKTNRPLYLPFGAR